MSIQRTRVGLHARNDVRFPEGDYELIRRAGIETLKMMSFTDPAVFDRLRREVPGLELIVRLHDDRIGCGSHPTPDEFVAKMVPLINALQPYATKFEIHNEPNHFQRIEGWGPTDDDARDFLAWYTRVLAGLKHACPWALFGFPGLGPNYPHRDLEWLAICKPAVLASDWLGCHCYWQYDNMLNPEWGQRFRLYRQRFPKTPLEITEFGDSTPGRPHAEVAQLYARYYQELFKYPYVRSACAFIASSPDPAWEAFVWRKESGEFSPLVGALGSLARPTTAPRPAVASTRKKPTAARTRP